MTTIAQKIQSDFQKEILSVNHINVDDIVIPQSNNIYLNLQKYGFNGITNLNSVKQKEEEVKNNELKKKFKEFLEKRELVTNKKLITFGKLYPILKKYDIHLGCVSGYIKELPEKNAKEVYEYIKYFSNGKKSISVNKKEPYTNQLGKSFFNYESRPNLMICASLDSFDPKNRFVFNNQVFWNSEMKFNLKPLEIPNPDPIVLNPIGTGDYGIDKLGLFEIVTAWDRESQEPEIFNQINN